MGASSREDDRPTVDLGPRALEDEAAADDLDAASDEAATAVPQIHDEVHILPTQQLGAQHKKLATGGSILLNTKNSTTPSPVEAMRMEEVARTRIFLLVALALCLGGIVVAFTSHGDELARYVVIIGSLCAMSASGWMLWVTNDPDRYTPRRMFVPGIVIVFGSMSGVYYWGTASPITAMLVYGIYFFSLGADRFLTAFMYGLVASIHGALGLGILTGAIEDHGVLKMTSLKQSDQITIILIIEFLYLITFITARVSQRVTLEAVSKLEQAVRNVGQRDAMLAEARAELDRALKIGGPGRFTEQVVGKFRLGILIGRGGMGEVYEAHGVADKHEAAVKLLHPSTLGDPTSVQRFIREANMAASLDTPHVVKVLEVGTTAGEIPYLAMERLRGHDLAHQLRRQRRLQLPQARMLVDQIAIGLEAARAAGIVHRDLKPHNVFFAESDGVRRWKILDFGVSKAGGTGTLTKGHVVGTPAYMSPEQARGEDVDHRADVYSLAAIIYRSLTGHPAFTGKDVPSTLYDVVYRIPTQPSILADVPVDVDRVLAIGLAKEPADRFATATELAEWFTAATEGGLSYDQRRRADDLIAKAPWGTRHGLSHS